MENQPADNPPIEVQPEIPPNVVPVKKKKLVKMSNRKDAELVSRPPFWETPQK